MISKYRLDFLSSYVIFTPSCVQCIVMMTDINNEKEITHTYRSLPAWNMKKTNSALPRRNFDKSEVAAPRDVTINKPLWRQLLPTPWKNHQDTNFEINIYGREIYHSHTQLNSVAVITIRKTGATSEVINLTWTCWVWSWKVQ